MAFAALVSLVQNLEHRLKQSDESLLRIAKPQIQSIYDLTNSIRTSLRRIFPVPRSIRPNLQALEDETREVVYTAQDTIESFLTSQILSPNSQHTQFLTDLQQIIDTLEPIAKSVEEIAAQDFKGKQEEEPPLDLSPPSTRAHKIVGQEEDVRILKGELLSNESKLKILPIVGMPGIGKTTLVKSIYDNPEIVGKENFDARARVTVSPDYNVREIFSRLLDSFDDTGQNTYDTTSKRTAEKHGLQDDLAKEFYQKLYNNRYLVVVDDMWETEVWTKVRHYFPDNNNGSRILLTTRDKDIAQHVSKDFCHEMKLLNNDNSWILLCDRAFEGGSCLPNLESIGKKIAENCRGLPLSLTVIGGQLSQGKKTEDYWNLVEDDIKAVAATAEDTKYMEILSLSYNHLPVDIKGCFLYLGAFPEDSEIPVTNLVKLWVAEGFIAPTLDIDLEQIARANVNILIKRNLVTVRDYSSNQDIKACGMHDVLRDVAVQECGKENFFQGMNKYDKEFLVGKESQRRLSVHRNILMCMKDIYDSTKVLKRARTLLYAGAHHHHPFPFSIAFDLLRVLDALTIYFIAFPKEVLHFIHLTYLSFTYNGKIPASIAKLSNLQVLIVRRQPKIIFLGTSFLPLEIWGMSGMRHIILTETDFPLLSSVPDLSNKPSILLENLQTLSNVHAACFTKEVIQHMPNLKKLGMWLEEPTELGFYIDELKDLEAFKFTVLRPSPRSGIRFLPEFAFPKKLRRLTLSGCGIPWEDMEVLAQLKNLEALKLREFAFHGTEWILNEPFYELKFLLLEGLNLEIWDADDSHFPSLKQLIINHCYDLEEIPSDLGIIASIELIEMVDCSPAATESAREIRRKQKEDNVNKKLRVRIFTSWE